MNRKYWQTMPRGARHRGDRAVLVFASLMLAAGVLAIGAILRDKAARRRWRKGTLR